MSRALRSGVYFAVSRRLSCTKYFSTTSLAEAWLQMAGRAAPPSRVSLLGPGTRILLVEAVVAIDIHQEDLPHVFQGIGQGLVIAVDLVPADPLILQPASPRPLHDQQSQFPFGAMLPARLPVPGLRTTHGVLRPVLRQKQSAIHRRGTLSPTQATKHSQARSRPARSALGTTDPPRPSISLRF